MVSVAIHDYLFDFINGFTYADLSRLHKNGTENLNYKLLSNALISLGQILYHAHTFPFLNQKTYAGKDFKKLCGFLVHFLYQKEILKLGFLKFLFACVKNRFYDFEFFGNLKLFGVLLKLLDNGDLNEKIMAAKILQIDTEFERELWRENGSN